MNRFSFATILALIGVVFASAPSATAESNTVNPNARPANASAASSWPLPLEMRVPFEPTAFPSAGRIYLTYAARHDSKRWRHRAPHTRAAAEGHARRFWRSS
jgi:hypothetical protein